MLSKITIEIDHDNQPIIKIKYEASPDVRDSLVKRFMETFHGASCFATFFFDNSVHDMANKVAHIRPIKPEEMKQYGDMIQDIVSGKRGSDGPLNGDK
jgi:hypothetical protein